MWNKILSQNPITMVRGIPCCLVFGLLVWTTFAAAVSMQTESDKLITDVEYEDKENRVMPHEAEGFGSQPGEQSSQSEDEAEDDKVFSKSRAKTAKDDRRRKAKKTDDRRRKAKKTVDRMRKAKKAVKAKGNTKDAVAIEKVADKDAIQKSQPEGTPLLVFTFTL